MEIKETVRKITEELIADSELYIVDIKAAAGTKSNKISVLLDSDKGISIDQCAVISRKLGERLEELNVLESAYTLEVSSPGVDEPLILERQYQKNIGRTVQVIKTDNSINKGKLEEVRNDSIVISVSDKKKKEVNSIEIDFKDIKKTNVLVSFR